MIEIRMNKEEGWDENPKCETILIEDWQNLLRFKPFDHLFYNLINSDNQATFDFSNEIMENLKEILSLNMSFSLVVPFSLEIQQLANIFSPLFSEIK